MGARGPKPGHGGAPRKTVHKPDGNGYTRSTVGPAGRGELKYDQRIKTGTAGQTPGKGAKTVVDHKNGNRADNRPSNLRVVSRSVNNMAKNKHK